MVESLSLPAKFLSVKICCFIHISCEIQFHMKNFYNAFMIYKIIKFCASWINCAIEMEIANLHSKCTDRYLIFIFFLCSYMHRSRYNGNFPLVECKFYELVLDVDLSMNISFPDLYTCPNIIYLQSVESQEREFYFNGILKLFFATCKIAMHSE